LRAAGLEKRRLNSVPYEVRSPLPAARHPTPIDRPGKAGGGVITIAYRTAQAVKSLLNHLFDLFNLGTPNP
jgi:hypothetical protein